MTYLPAADRPTRLPPGSTKSIRKYATSAVMPPVPGVKASRDPKPTLEGPAEHVRAAKADREGDPFNAVSGCSQPFARCLQAQRLDVVPDRRPEGLLEKPCEVARARAKTSRQHLEGQVLGKAFRQPGREFCKPIGRSSETAAARRIAPGRPAASIDHEFASHRQRGRAVRPADISRLDWPARPKHASRVLRQSVHLLANYWDSPSGYTTRVGLPTAA